MINAMWKDIIGCESQIEELKGYIKTGKLPHAFLFAGMAGLGKTKTAREFFKAVNCSGSTGDGCDSCRTCLKVLNGSHPDLVSVSPSNGWIVVEDIRTMISEVGLKPFEARTRFIIIEPAERMNKASSNALLKTLEEPPDGSLIILISHKPALLLPTIVSRCQIIRFAPLDASAAEKSAIDPVLLRLTSGTMGGLPSGDAEYLLEVREAVLDSIRDGDPAGLVNKYFSDAEQGPETLSVFLLVAESILRDLLVLSHGGGSIINEELREAVRRGIGSQGAEEIALCIRDIRRGVNENINQRVAMSDLLFRLKGIV